MKLRCTHNSIRIRIRKSELKELAESRRVEEAINFGGAVVLSFILEINPATEQVNASFLENQLVVSLPKKQAFQWMNSNQVGIEVNKPIGKEQTLHVLIEKDFPCLDREEEDKSDTFWELAPETPDAC